MQVLAGADKKVDVIIQASDGNIVDQHRWSSMGTTDRFILNPGNANDMGGAMVFTAQCTLV